MDAREMQRTFGKQQAWLQEYPVLLAVSTGVDSMVLLDLMLANWNFSRQRLAVAHVNHQLRPESVQEARFLRAYCAQRKIPYFQANWEPTLTNVEGNARQFRYAFFQSIMNEKGYKVLLTAHHSDDQVETMIMKAVRDGQVSALKGIVPSQAFADEGQLVRPLLSYEKATLYNYAKERQLIFFEDNTNEELTYFRNRIRHQVLPILKEEQPQLAKQFQQIANQVIHREALLEELSWEKGKQLFHPSDNGWSITLSQLNEHSKLEQMYLFEKAAHTFRKTTGLNLSQKQIDQTLRLLCNAHKPQWTMDIGQEWIIRRAYDYLYIERNLEQTEMAKSYSLMEDTQFFLSDHQWIGLLPTPIDEKLIPKELCEWQTVCLPLASTVTLPLEVRKRKNGDRLKLTPALTKRLSRWLIDHKIPQKQRDEGWVVLDSTKNELAFFPFFHSYLSIERETDKIRYVLLYKYRK
ncbi:tRNA lysidine(34) synthetase TilS [Enterococcus camelliae]|uniref:tRNA(Ile)-lysidine synthase n=1 Tax=Enterococcus camelliae TaxID=453959 RepID=A0ABW5TG91_9ENTE